MNWNDITLYHGTTNVGWKSILKDGVRIPAHDANWLGRGMYFGVNNVLTPIRYALNNCNSTYGKTPIIVEINAAQVRQDILDKILNLTNHAGLIDWYFISEKFKGFAKSLVPEVRQSLLASPLYSQKVKTALTLDMEWYYFLKQIEPIILSQDSTSPFILDLKTQAAIHIYNLIIDWFNYSVSGGDENEIPIKGMLGTFNTGEPMSSFETSRKSAAVSKRIFFDYVSFLNRIELSIFGFKYYQAYDKGESGWALTNLFKSGKVKEGVDYTIYSGKDQIIGLLERIVKSHMRMQDEEKYEATMLCKELYTILGLQDDTLYQY